MTGCIVGNQFGKERWDPTVEGSEYPFNPVGSGNCRKNLDSENLSWTKETKFGSSSVSWKQGDYCET